MSSADDVGLLNQAGLAIAEVVAVIETASVTLDEAQNKILNILIAIRAVRGELDSPTLNNYITMLQDSLEALRRSQHSNVEAIHSLHKGHDLGQEYIGKLHL